MLALQGDFVEHQKLLKGLSVDTIQVRKSVQLEELDGLIIPGGESTTIGKLALDFEMMEPLRAFAKEHAVWGTCAGSIFLSKDARRDQPLLGVMDIQVERNAFGRQVDSFEAKLAFPALGERPYPAVFIRAPIVESTTPPVHVLARLDDGKIVAVRQGRMLATAFHPELSADLRLHRYFLKIVAGTG